MQTGYKQMVKIKYSKFKISLAREMGLPTSLVERSIHKIQIINKKPLYYKCSANVNKLNNFFEISIIT